MLFEVAIKSPLRKLFTYESDIPLSRGIRVKVPFGSREVVGIVWNQTDVQPKGLKKISKVLDETPFFDPRSLQFYEKASQYYGISLGELLSNSVPKAIQDGKPLRNVEKKIFNPKLVSLSEQQKKISDQILSQQKFIQHLLMGETGSGKTEIYLSVIAEVLKAGGQALFLVPEISLTPQFEDRLRERLGANVSLFHSQLTEKKREETFARAFSGEPDLFLGARSALFLPFKNLKFIAVDEEHDSSYKQSERGTYNARDLALLRAQMFDLPIVLGSATPSLESFVRAKETHTPIYELAPFYSRPKVKQKVIDLKKTWKESEKSFISPTLHDEISERLEKGEQTLLFLNRRGSASQRVCVQCGTISQCKLCSVTLTPHRDLQKLLCHWCGYQEPLKAPCKSCGSDEFFEGGIGTKEVEAQINLRFPEARIARLDRDEVAKAKNFAETLREFAEGKIDILVGTQMISKGIDIPNLSLVGMILADMGWGIPDFRGTERAFQLLKQLRGRAGRRGQDSSIVIQTFNPEHPVFGWIESDTAFHDFADNELSVRKMGNFPPLSKLSLFILSHRDQRVLERESAVFGRRVQALAKPLGIEVWGPTPAPLSRWKGLYRAHLLCRSQPKAATTALLSAVLDEVDRGLGKALKVKLDRDPAHFL